MWFIGVEVEQETSAPPPKKNPGSAPDTEYHPGTLLRNFITRPISGYSKGEPLRLETLTLFRPTQNPTIYTLFRATPSMFLNNTIFSTKTHVPAPRYGQYLVHAHNHITPAVAATFSWKISGSRLLWTTVSSSLGFIRRYMTWRCMLLVS